jgi:hypothetical protein
VGRTQGCHCQPIAQALHSGTNMAHIISYGTVVPSATQLQRRVGCLEQAMTAGEFSSVAADMLAAVITVPSNNTTSRTPYGWPLPQAATTSTAGTCLLCLGPRTQSCTSLKLRRYLCHTTDHTRDAMSSNQLSANNTQTTGRTAGQKEFPQADNGQRRSLAYLQAPATLCGRKQPRCKSCSLLPMILGATLCPRLHTQLQLQ